MYRRATEMPFQRSWRMIAASTLFGRAANVAKPLRSKCDAYPAGREAAVLAPELIEPAFQTSAKAEITAGLLKRPSALTGRFGMLMALYCIAEIGLSPPFIQHIRATVAKWHAARLFATLTADARQ